MIKHILTTLMSITILASPLGYGSEITEPEVIATGGMINEIDVQSGRVMVSDKIFIITPYTKIEASGFKNGVITQLKPGDSVSLKYYRLDDVDYVDSIKVMSKITPPGPIKR